MSRRGGCASGLEVVERWNERADGLLVSLEVLFGGLFGLLGGLFGDLIARAVNKGLSQKICHH